MDFDFPVTLVDKKLLKSIFKQKEKFHLNQARLPIEEKINILVELQKITFQIEKTKKVKRNLKVWKIQSFSVNKAYMKYFEKDDIIHLAFSKEKEMNNIELTPNITVEMNDKGELIGIEILNVSDFLRDYVLESVQAKMLNLFKTKAS